MRTVLDRQKDAWIVVGLLALMLISRIPFRSQMLYHWDSVNFAYAMREFDVAKEQPQTPGYIVYVWLCRFVNIVVNDAQTTMVIISIAASALAVLALFRLGRSMFDRRVGLIAALFLAASPLFWFYGEVALPHTLDTLLVIVNVWWLYEVMQGNHRYLYPAVLALAVTGGVRQQTMVFLAPLLLFALRRVGWKRFLIAGAIGAVICLAWFVPLMVLSGGLSNYMRIMSAYTYRFQSTTSVFLGGGWWGVRRNVLKLTMYTLYGWSVTMVPAIIYVASRVWRYAWLQCWEKPIFLMLWVVPSLAYYSLIHMGQQGLIFVFLPALLLLSAVGLVRLLTIRPPWLVPVTAAILAAVNVFIFCLAPEYPLGDERLRLLTRATIVNSDHYYQDRIGAIESGFAPDSTAILAKNWHHVEYYLPEYMRLPFGVGGKWEKDTGSPRGNFQELVATPVELGLRLDGRGQAAIVVFDPELMAFNESPASVHDLLLKHGAILEYFVLDGEQHFHYGAQSFGPRERE